MTPDQAHELAGKITTAVLDQIEKDRYHPMSDNIKMVIATQLMAGAPQGKKAGLPLDNYTQDDVIALAAETMQLVYEVSNMVTGVNAAVANALTNARAALKRFGLQV